MIVSSYDYDKHNFKNYIRGSWQAKLVKNGGSVDIWFNDCGIDRWISIPLSYFVEFLSEERIQGEELPIWIEFDWPLDGNTLLKKIQKMKPYNEAFEGNKRNEPKPTK